MTRLRDRNKVCGLMAMFHNKNEEISRVGIICSLLGRCDTRGLRVLIEMYGDIQNSSY